MRNLKLFAIVSFCVAVFLAPFLVACFFIMPLPAGPPKEDKIVSNFKAHRASFERLRAMLLEDNGVEGVANWGVYLKGSPLWKTPPVGGVQVKRYQEYLALLKEIGAIRVDQGEYPSEVAFEVWVAGFAADTRHIEVCWLEREPPNIVINLDAFYRTEKPRIPSYVHIDGNWYIWADW